LEIYLSSGIRLFFFDWNLVFVFVFVLVFLVLDKVTKSEKSIQRKANKMMSTISYAWEMKWVSQWVFQFSQFPPPFPFTQQQDKKRAAQVQGKARQEDKTTQD
jgi:hypothetical protein